MIYLFPSFLNLKREDYILNNVVIYTKFITTKNGRKLYAKAYGKKAFRIVVKQK